MRTIESLRKEAMECLTQNILPFWTNNMQDHEHDGWYGQMTGRYKLRKDAPRGAVLYARLLWTFSAAYRVLNDKEHLAAATQTKEYIEQHFLDSQYGGVIWSVTADGQPLDTKKQFYAMGFMIYGFSEYARATAHCSDPRLRAASAEALATALQLFDIVERHGWDAEYDGYIEACTRDWQPIADMRLSDKDENYPKSQNTHLHIIEPYTNLLRTMQQIHCPVPPLHGSEWLAQKMEALKSALRRLIDVFINHILNPETHHLDLFFEMDWSRMSSAESYGHDIECSWLLHEAALVLGDTNIIKKIKSVIKEVAKASEKGLRPDGSMTYESGDEERHWWVQAEAIVGFLNLYQHFGDETALQKALRLWEYVKAHLIDHEHGEWYWSVNAGGTVNLDDDHAGFWKCPYHNGRMCLEIIERPLIANKL